MTGTAFVTAARAVGLALVLVLAAASGLMVGNAIQGRDVWNAGYPDGWQGGAAAPRSITADSAFSLDAISAVQAARGDARAPDYVDFGLRHLAVDTDASVTTEQLAQPTLR
jgi:hypothetical protein